MYFLIVHTFEWYKPLKGIQPSKRICFLNARAFEGIYFLSLYLFGMHMAFEGMRAMTRDPRPKAVQYIIP